MGTMSKGEIVVYGVAGRIFVIFLTFGLGRHRMVFQSLRQSSVPTACLAMANRALCKGAVLPSIIEVQAALGAR